MREYLLPGSSVDLGELVPISVTVRVHLQHFFQRRSPQRLDDLHKLVDVAVAPEDGLKSNHFYQDAACRPHVDLSGVASASENELRGSIAARADVCKIWLPDYKLLS